MIIEPTYKLNDVVTIKMIGGDEIVGRLTNTENGTTLSKPMVVMMSQQGFGLAPFVLTANPDAKLTINESAIICITKTFDAVAKEYTKQTSGIIT